MTEDRQREDGNFEVLLRNVRPDGTPPAGAQDRVLGRLLAAIHARRSLRRCSTRRRRLWPRVAVVGASAAAAALITVGVWVMAVGVGQATADFGHVLEFIREAGSVEFDVVLLSGGQPVDRFRVEMLGSDRVRTVAPDGTVKVYDRGRAEVLSLYPSEGLARLVRVEGHLGYGSLLDALKAVTEEDGTFLGEEVLDGVPTRVYQASLPGQTLKVWADRKRSVPLQIESVSGSGQERVRVVLKNMAWNVPLDESLFALDVPPGYRVETIDAAPSVQGLIRMLRICAELNGKTFPDRLDDGTVRALIAESTGTAGAMIGAEGTVAVADHTEEGRVALSRCLSGLNFVRDARGRDGWTYSGRGVRLGDSERVVCAWTVSGSGERMALSGDLELRTAPTDRQ